MVEHRPPQVGDDPFTGRHHQIETAPRRSSEHGGERNHRRHRLVEQLRLAAAEAPVDHQLHALPQREDAAGGH